MKNEDLNDLLTSQLESAKIDYSRNIEIWKVLPNTDCQVGYDGRNSLLRLPMDNVESTNWKTENKLLRSRYSKTIQSFLQISFDIKNIEIEQLQVILQYFQVLENILIIQKLLMK